MPVSQDLLSKLKLKQPAPAIFLLSGFVILASLEILLRIFWTPLPLAQHELFTEYDPIYGWKKIPNLQRVYEGDEYSILETFNSKGIRGPEYPYAKPAEEFRILILGDSHSEGYSVEFENLFSEVLKKKLQERGDRPYQVISAGTRAYSTDHQLLFFEKEGRRYQPDLTILMFSTPNVWQNNQKWMDGRLKPLFRLEHGQLQLVHSPDLKPPSSLSVRRFLKTQCFLCRFIHQEIRRNAFFSWILKFKVDSMPDHLSLWRKRDHEKSLQAWQLTEALLVKLTQEVRNAGSRFLVCYVPGPDQIDGQVWRATRKKYALIGKAWDARRVDLRLGVLCKKNRIDFMSLTDPLTAVRKIQQTELYFLTDGHWTPHGHEFAGEILADYIRQNNLAR